QIAEHLPESPALLYYAGLTSGWHDSFRDLVFDEARFQTTTFTEMKDRVLGLGAFPGNDVPSAPSIYGNRTEPVNATVTHDEQSLIYEMTHFQSVPESTAIVRDKLYGTLMFTSLGIPMLWEGMEYGESRGWTSEGQKLRYRPVDAPPARTASGNSHHAYYRSLILQRRFNPALYRGVLRLLQEYPTEKVLTWGFEDTLGTAKVMALANFQGTAQTVRNVTWLSTGIVYHILDGTPFTAGSLQVDSITLPPYTALVFSNIPETTLVFVAGRFTREIPKDFALEQNYPNPFNPKTGVRFQVPGVSDVKLAVYDLIGREVAVLVNERKAAGSFQVTFDGNGLASGIYFYRLEAVPVDGLGRPFIQTRKMILVK
ncbi:T9SS C-terminal target domain-containing protein, partial [bacterium]